MTSVDGIAYELRTSEHLKGRRLGVLHDAMTQCAGKIECARKERLLVWDIGWHETASQGPARGPFWQLRHCMWRTGGDAGWA
jgi:hypothetical protein